ncbi:hypothetical protein GH714_003204 [Hevea brasiliensis]|uniref:AB hydrolase-1 domain-containing protein n=1 Tax=Hevea brasiliensis TaxID=3981 RepID=A0A6A6KGL2_HEVBR|nr:hypothetical protein GH714_003204 [Hevea brasiliensis]
MPDGGPPRWFCPLECGQPRKNSPTLLFLPGMDGVGLGLTLHHKALGKVFEVWCLHIPVYDRTPFEGLVKLVEETVRIEHAASPNRPIYLVGDSFGGCLALAVAARNPKIDLVLILANPATSFGRSQLEHLLPILEALPDGLHNAVPYLLSFVMGDPLKMAMVDIENRLLPKSKIEQLSGNLTALLPLLSGLTDIFPRETLLWKLKLLNSAAAYANSCLQAVKAEVLVLASGKDYILPSGDEAKRLKSSLRNCTVRLFKEHGHAILLGEEYKLIWPNRQEFVRMAARFGATIVPFGTVGEDDIVELVLDYNDLMKIPFVNEFVRKIDSTAARIRDESQGEVANQKHYIPGLLPKLPGRFYFLFGKPIETKGKEELLKDRNYANELYLQVKSEIKHNMDYLLKKREEDPYRSIIDRTLYGAINSRWQDIPAFDP